MKLLKHRTKFEAFGAICVVTLLIAISVMASTRIISDSSDNIATFITNSNGGHWGLTPSNLQSAINNLNNLSGWVNIPSVINTSTLGTIKVGDNCTLFSNSKGGIVNNQNVTLIENYDQTNGNYEITIKNLYLDGKCTSFNPGIPGTDVPENYANGVEFKNTISCTVDNCIIRNVSGIGVCGRYANYTTISNCDIGFSGRNWEGTGIECCRPSGIWLESCEGGIIKSNRVHDSYSVGIVYEHRLCPSIYGTIEGNECWNNYYGIYVEAVERISINNNIVHDNNKEEAYASPTYYAGGIRMGAAPYPVYDSECIGNILYNNGNGSSANGQSIFVEGSFNNIADNIINLSKGNAIYVSSGKNNNIANNIINNTGSTAILVCTKNTKIDSNQIYNSGGSGIKQYYYTGFDPEDNECSSISNNIIDGTTLHGIQAEHHNQTITGNAISDVGSGYDGIYLKSVNNSTISSNSLSTNTNAGEGIDLSNCLHVVVGLNTIKGFDKGIRDSGISDYNLYGLNDASGCTNGFDIDTNGNCNWTCNMGSYI